MTDKNIPAPLVSVEIDLRGYPYMPLDVVRLRDSWIARRMNGEVFRAAVLSWCVSWHQVPAGSLPDDDEELCSLLGYGRALKEWRGLRDGGALHGWVKCSDGRLYHPVVVEKAIEGWEKKRKQRGRTKAATEARVARQRNEDRNDGGYEQRNEQRNVERNELRNVECDDATLRSTLRSPRESKGTVKGEGEKERKEATATAVQQSRKYAFENGIIKLHQTHLDNWRQSFTHLDVPAELIGLTEWAEQQGPQRWFQAVCGALAKRNREVKAKADAAKNGPEFKWKSGMEGIV